MCALFASSADFVTYMIYTSIGSMAHGARVIPGIHLLGGGDNSLYLTNPFSRINSKLLLFYKLCKSK